MEEKYIEEDVIDIKELLKVLAKGKKTVVITSFVFGVLAIVYALIATPQYDTSTKMIYESKSSGGMGGNLGALAAMAGMGSTGDGDISDYIADIMYSGEFLKPILKKEWQVDEDDSTKMNLITYWEMEVDSTKPHAERVLYQSAAEGLKKKISYAVDKKTSLITLSTSFETAYLSYQINNYVVEELNKVILTKTNKKTRESRIFVEQRLVEVKKDLSNVENALKRFKEQNRSIMSPSLFLEEQRLIREIEIQQKVFLTLRQQYEMARIEEQKDIPAITVIEKAEIPYKKSKPQKKKIVLMGGFAGIFVGIFLVFVLDWYRKNRDTVLEIIKA